MKDAGGLLSALLVALGLAVGHTTAWLLYRLRLKQLAGRLRAQMEHRSAQRANRAAALHDGLLQDVQGLALSLQAVADRLAPDDPTRQRLEQVLDRTDDVLSERRRRAPDGDAPDDGD